MESLLGVGIILLCVGIYIAIFLAALACYILTAISFQTIAKRRGIEKPWLAWIPYAQYYTVGKVTNDYDKRNGYDRPWHKYLIASAVIFAILMTAGYMVFYFGVVVSAILADAQSYYEPGTMEILAIVGYIGIILGAVAGAAFNTLYFISIYKIFESLKPEKAIKYMLLFILVPFAGPICLYKNRYEGYSAEDTSVPAESDFSGDGGTSTEV